MGQIDRSYNPKQLVPAVEFALQSENGVLFHCVDKSWYGPTEFLWEFGDEEETTSAYHNPVFTYTKNGTYTVKLTATNQYGSASAEQQVTIKGNGQWLIQDDGTKFTVNLIGDGETTSGEGGLGLDNI